MPESNSAEPTVEPVRQKAGVDGKLEQTPQTAKFSIAGPAVKRPLWIWIAGGVLIVLALTKAVPFVINALRTVSTDDAYVNGDDSARGAIVLGRVLSGAPRQMP